MRYPANDKIYVVFEGRRPGIYFSWVDCEAQVHRFKRNLHKSFETYEEAEEEWMKYSTQKGRGDAYVERGLRPVRHEAAPTLNMFGRAGDRLGTGQGQFALDSTSNDFVLHYAVQRQLDHVCNSLRIQPAVYTLHQVTEIGGIEYRRYYASLSGAPIGTPAVSLGRYATDDYNAKEDCAVLLLRRLLAATGRKIRDFNYYNVELLESRVEKLMDEKLELEMVISLLNTELQLAMHA